MRIADHLAQPFADEVVAQRIVERIAGERMVQRGEIVVRLKLQIGPRPRRVVAEDRGAVGLMAGWFLEMLGDGYCVTGTQCHRNSLCHRNSMGIVSPELT